MRATHDEPVEVSVLGIGAIGSRVAGALLAAGHRVTVWNRTAGRVGPLVERGASGAASATEAVSASRLVILCLTGYPAVNEVTGGVAGVLPGRTVVALTTGSAEDARHTASRVEAAGATYLDGSPQTTLEAIGTTDATFLYSGSRPAFDQDRAVLATLGTARYVGADAGAGAVQELTLYGLWYDAQIAYLRALETVREAGIAVEEFAPLAAAQLGHVVKAAEGTAREVVARDYPRGPASLTEHEPVIRDLAALRRAQRLGTGGLDLVHDLVRQHIEHGRADDGLTAILEPTGRPPTRPHPRP